MKPTLYWLIALLELYLMQVICVISRFFFPKFRLKEYQSKLILFPVNSKKPRKGEATEEDIKKASQLAGSVIPIKPVVKRQRAMEVTDDLKNFKVISQDFLKGLDMFCSFLQLNEYETVPYFLRLSQNLRYFVDFCGFTFLNLQILRSIEQFIS